VIHPQESTHRASRIATDMAIQLSMQLDTLSEFISKKEMLHLQLQMLYVLIDIMSATSKTKHENVLDLAREYFKRLRQEVNNGEV
jgi:hypothetical protein